MEDSQKIDSQKEAEEFAKALEDMDEMTAMDYFLYVRNNVNRLEGFLNAGSNAEAKRIIDTITEDLQEIRNRL